jgi:hypothetical protein
MAKTLAETARLVAKRFTAPGDRNEVAVRDSLEGRGVNGDLVCMRTVR